MNYYERHLGDYAKDAGHLSMLEHGAYTLLIDRYYGKEEPLPADQVHRICRARTDDERAAVDAVLVEFFRLIDGVWVQKRCDEVISRYHDSQVDSDQERKHEADRKRRYRQRRSELFASLREFGIVPPFKTAMSDLESMLSRAMSHGTDAGHTQGRPGNGTATQKPDTSNQHKSDIDTPATLAGECAKAMRSAGCVSINQSNPDFLAALDEGVTPKEFADATEEAKGRGISGAGLFTYAIGIARTNHVKTANQITGATHGNATSRTGRKLSVVDEVARAILERRGREPYDDEPPTLAAIGHG